MSPSLEILVLSGGALSALGLGYALWHALAPAPAAVPAADGAEAPVEGLVREASPSGAGAYALGRLSMPDKPEEQDALRRALVQAGWRGRRASLQYLTMRAALALIVPLPLALLLHPRSLLGAVFAVLLGVSLGYYAPWLAVRIQRKRRQRRLLSAFPNALDMLVSCLEGGLSLNTALQQAAKDLAFSAPELAAELEIVTLEGAAGLARGEALRRLHERTGLEEVRSLANVLSHAERYGASVGSSIRAHAQLVRHRRMLAAEKMAAKAAPKLTIAMVLLILPALFVVILGPTIINVVEHLLPALQRASMP